MAALDFPASPTNGQVYANWIYSSSKGAWQAKPITGKVTTSAVAPSAPTNGDEWFNTNDGNLYVYYTDVDGSQWVQVKSDATLSSTLGNRVTALETYPSGLVPVVPTSVTVSSGSATTNTNGQVSFTGSLNVSLNGVFTSGYKNYKIVLSHGSGAASQLYIRYITSGTPNSSALYTQGGYWWRSTGAASGYYNQNGATAHGLGFTGAISNAAHAYSIDIQNPAVSDFTTFQSNAVGTDATSLLTTVTTGAFQGATAFDGFQIYNVSGTGNLNGAVQVYGLR